MLIPVVFYVVSRLFARPERGQFEDSLDKKEMLENREFDTFLKSDAFVE